MTPIATRIAPPTPAEVRAARKAVGLTQAEASMLVADVPAERAERTWQNYEADVGKSTHRAIPVATWELFLLLTGQHPTHQLVERVGVA